MKRRSHQALKVEDLTNKQVKNSSYQYRISSGIGDSHYFQKKIQQKLTFSGSLQLQHWTGVTINVNKKNYNTENIV